MKVVIALALCIAAVSALQPRDIRIPESQLFPKYTAAQWAELYADQEYSKEIVENFKPGTEPQPIGAGSVSQDIDTHIIGGSNAVSGQFPWQASITMDSSYFCGGSIISRTWLLTAGHCVDGVSNLAIVVGSLSPNAGASGTSSQTSRTKILHSGYNSNTIANDIGLIKLSTALTFTSQVSAVRLPRHSQSGTTFAGLSTRVSGWGRTSDSSSGISSVLKYVDLTVITNTVCAATYGTIIRASNICTSGANGKSTCNGDSGGPLVYLESDGLYTEVGIVSFGSSAGCELGYPAAFTRVTSYLDWIETNSGIIIGA